MAKPTALLLLQATAADTAMEVGRLSIRGLKEKKKPTPPQGPYDPFGGLDFEPTRYTLHVSTDYRGEVLEKFRHDQRHTVGGYSFAEYTARAVFDAFAGMGVFIEDEKESGHRPFGRRSCDNWRRHRGCWRQNGNRRGQRRLRVESRDSVPSAAQAEE